MKHIIPVIPVLIILACGTAEEEGIIPEEGAGPDTLILSIRDTIGVLMGDSIVEFGSISWAGYTGNGSILVLDALKATLSEFDGNGEHMAVHFRKGSGPGEFQFPRYMALLSDGTVAVSDWGNNTVSILDGSYNHLKTLEGFYPVAPAYLCPFPDSGFVGGGMELFPADNEIGYDGITFAGLWQGSSEPVLRYAEFPLDISVEGTEESVSVNVDNVDAVLETDSRGQVYVSVRSDSTYLIDCYAPDGTCSFTIEREWERIAKTPEELEREIVLESHSRSNEGATRANREIVEDTYPWHNAISCLKTDDRDNLWVGLGYTSAPSFHVYSNRGEFLHVVVIPELEGVQGLDWNFRNGLLAYDHAPEDYPKVYILDF